MRPGWVNRLVNRAQYFPGAGIGLAPFQPVPVRFSHLPLPAKPLLHHLEINIIRLFVKP
jgi:hypothetical protein